MSIHHNHDTHSQNFGLQNRNNNQLPQSLISNIALPSTQLHRSTLSVFFVCLNCALSAFYVGYALVYISTLQSFSTIIEIYSINIGGAPDVTQSIVTGCVPVGAIFGALSSSIFLKKFSRRNCFLVTNTLAIVSMGIILVKLAPMILIGRFLQGFCTGIYSAIVPLYINEFAPITLSKLGTMNQVLISTAQSFVFFLYFLLTDPFELTDVVSWDYLSNFLIVTVSVQTLVFLFVFPYETPKYWLIYGNEDKCRELLQVIYLPEHAQQILQQIKLTVDANKQQTQSAINQTQNQKFAPSETLNQKLQPSVSQPQQSLLSTPVKMCKLAFYLAIHIALFQQLTGVNSVALYGGKIVNSVLPSLNKIIPIFTNMLPGIAAGVATGLMKRYGRKTLLQLGGGLLILPLIMMSVGFITQAHTDSEAPKILIVASLFLYMGGFGLTLGPIVWLYIPEFVEPRVIPYSTMANMIGASVCIIIFPIASAQLPNKAYLFGFFLIWGIVSMIINQRYLVQTKDKTRQEVYRQQNEIQKKYFKN